MKVLAGALALIAAAGLVTGSYLERPGQWAFILLGLLTPALGWLIAVRRPDVRYGWLLLATACCLGLGTLGVGVSLHTESLLAYLLTILFSPFFGLMWIYLPLLFPDGRLPSRRWRPVAWIGAVGVFMQTTGALFLPVDFSGVHNPIKMSGGVVLAAALTNGIGQLIVVATALVVLVGLIVRWRRAAPGERRQYPWIIAGAASSLIGFVLVFWFLTGGGAVLGGTGILVQLGSLPAAIGVALVRYRLLDIKIGVRGSRLSLVFDMRPTVGELLSELGPELQEAEPGEQLAGLARAVQAGLDVRWAQVSLAAGAVFTAGTRDTREAAAVSVSVAGGLGELAVGPKNQGRLTAEDRRLLHAFAVPVGLAIRSAALATRLVNAQEAERRRLERNIHDGVQQQLVALIAGLELARASGDAHEMLPPLREQARQTLDDLRELAAGIHPSVLTQGGLVEAVESRGSRLPVPTTVTADPGLRATRFADEIEGALYLTVSEALANALKHAGADKIEVRLSHRDGRLRAVVSDDGRGFEHAETALGALGDRLRALGGGLAVASTIGKGTTVSAWVPAHG